MVQIINTNHQQSFKVGPVQRAYSFVEQASPNLFGKMGDGLARVSLVLR